jgi:hypothetical protein
MDLLETMYKVTWLRGDFKGGYAYRGTQRIGFTMCDEGGDVPKWIAAVNWIYEKEDAIRPCRLDNFETEREAEEYVEKEWRHFVDEIMEE